MRQSQGDDATSSAKWTRCHFNVELFETQQLGFGRVSTSTIEGSGLAPPSGPRKKRTVGNILRHDIVGPHQAQAHPAVLQTPAQMNHTLH